MNRESWGADAPGEDDAGDVFVELVFAASTSAPDATVSPAAALASVVVAG